MRRLIALAALVAMALAAAGGPARAQPPGMRLFLPLLARPPQLVLVSNRDSGGTVDEVAADGTGRRTLSGPTTNDFQPFPAPDGRHVAFFSTRDGRNALYVMARDGSGQRRLAEWETGGHVQWLPDSRRLLLFAMDWRDGAAPPPRVLMQTGTLLDLAGGPPVPQPNYSVPSPDGAWVAYIASEGGLTAVRVRSTAGGPPQTVAGGFRDTGVADLTWSPDGGRLAFRAIYSEPAIGVYMWLYIAGLDGRQPQRVGQGELPLWSPDGSLLAFMGMPERVGAPERIAVVDRDGGEPRAIDDGLHPVWSPDSGQLAYLDRSAQGYPEVLKVADLRSGSQRELATSAGKILGWTPDGARLVYQALDSAWPVRIVAQGGGAPVPVAGLGMAGALTWSPDGARAATVSFGPGGERASVYTFRADGGDLRELGEGDTPRWTPDGRLLVTGHVRVPPRIYSRSEAAADLVPLAAGELIALAPRGERVAYVRGGRLFVSPTGRAEERALAPELTVTARPAWSPDGTRLAAAAATAGGAPGLYVLDAAGGGAQRAAPCGPGCGGVSWSPDGATLLYRDGGMVVTVQAAGGQPLPLVAGADPAWSPDGRQIAYVAGDIFVMGADGGGARRVAACGTDSLRHSCAQLVWSPDGARLAYGLVANYGKSVTRTVRVVALADGAELAAVSGWDARWPRGAALPAVRVEQPFGVISQEPYVTSSAYAKLCLEQPCRPYPPGHGDVLEYAIAP